MCGVQTILVHVDAASESVLRLELALELADRFDAQLTALFAASSGADREIYSAAAALVLEEESHSVNSAAQSRLRSLPCVERRQVTWCEMAGVPVTRGFVAEAAYADLLVIGAPGPKGSAAVPGFVESVILESGRPALVIPSQMRVSTLARRALVAWNESPAAARALSGALPLLQACDEVHVASWGARPPGAPFSRLDIGQFLRRHGVDPVLHHFDASAKVTTEIRTLASHLHADVIVMGCYGHSRTGERVFGGATRSMLEVLHVPVLMAH